MLFLSARKRRKATSPRELMLEKRAKQPLPSYVIDPRNERMRREID